MHKYGCVRVVHAKVSQRELAYIEAKPLVGRFFEPKIIHIQCACAFQVQCHSKLLVGVAHCFAWQVTHTSRLRQSTSALMVDSDTYPWVFQFQNAILVGTGNPHKSQLII